MGFIDDICKTIPKAENKYFGFFLLICNLLIPGSGTIIGAINNKCIGLQIIIGILQFILFPLLIGWLWSFMWGFKILDKSGNQIREVYETRTISQSEPIPNITINLPRD